MKKVLIISPNFPPVNAADMHRIRMSLPYFEQYGWKPVILAVNERFSTYPIDPLLAKSIPVGIKVVKTGLLPAVGPLKGLALRAIWNIYRKGKHLLSKEKYDLVYFSTTMFPIPVLGYFWKKKFAVPYVIDMQDPWQSDYYTGKPASERPRKHWFSSRLHKLTEPLAMKSVNGLISVSPAYVSILQNRYPRLQHLPSRTIPFSAAKTDMVIAKKHRHEFDLLFNPDDGYKHLVYMGRGGHDMHKALHMLFGAFKRGLSEESSLFGMFRMHFIGTDYAPPERARKTIQPLADKMGIGNYVSETTGRIPYYLGLAHLLNASGLIIPGSDDRGYTASKIYPCLLTEKPLLGIFHPESLVADVLHNYRQNSLITLGQNADQAFLRFRAFIEKCIPVHSHEPNLRPLWDSEDMTREQVELFNKIV